MMEETFKVLYELDDVIPVIERYPDENSEEYTDHYTEQKIRDVLKYERAIGTGKYGGVTSVMWDIWNHNGKRYIQAATVVF